MKNLVFFDVDNTILKGQSQEIMIRYLLHKKFITYKTYLILIVWVVLYKLNLVYDPLKPMEYGVSFIKGRSKESIDEMITKFYQDILRPHIFEEARNEVKKHIEAGDILVLITNSLDVLIDKIARDLNIKYYISTKLEVDTNGKYTGKILGEIMYADKKLSAAKEFINNNNFSGMNTWFYSDHHSDVSLLSYVNNPIVVNPTKKLQNIAIGKNWKILIFK